MVKVAVAGAINWDINLFVDRFPKVGEEVPVERITRVPGGKAANVAVASARVLGLGNVALIGCLGRDSIAKAQMRILSEEGVVTSGIKIIGDQESGQAYIIIDKRGRNVINTFFGANLKLLPEDLEKPQISKLIEQASIIALIDPPLETIEHASSIAKKIGKTVVWDAGVRSVLGIERLKDVLKNLDYLVINQVEVKNLTGEDDPRDAWVVLSSVNRYIKLVAKLGERGCLMVGPDVEIEVKAVNLKRLGKKVVNTVGCGDAFLGVFIASKAEGFDDKESLERANLAGALKATRYETRGSPTRAELELNLRFKERGKCIKRD